MSDITQSFVPSATTAPIGVSPMTAQPVQPMQNAAPAQMEKMGAVTEHLGLQVQDIGERIQNQLDDGMAKNAESKFLQTAISINNGDGTAANPGYLHTKGETAINGLADAQTALAKAKQAGADSLSSDFQKAMYNRVAQQHLLSFGAQMADHHFQQVTQYATEASLDRAQVYATKAALSGSSYGQTDAAGQPTGDYYTAQQAAIAEARQAALVQGAPAGSDVSNAGVLKVTTLMGQGALLQAMDAKQPFTTVQRMYDDMKAKGQLDLQAIDSMGKQVKTYVDGEQGHTIVMQTLSDAQRAAAGQPTTSTGTPDYHFAIKGAAITSAPYDKEAGGVELSIPANTPVQAPAGGVVSAAGPNKDGVPSLQITHQDGSVTSLTGLNAFNVKVGDKVQSGEDVGTSGAFRGTPGNQKQPSVFWSLQDPNGKAVDPTRAGLPMVDTSKITDENVLHNALDSIRTQIADPKQQALATDEAEMMVKVNQRNANAQKAQTLQSATDAFYGYANQHGGKFSMTSIPPSLQGQIPPEALARFRELTQVGPADKDGAIDARAGFILKPETQTVAAVNAIRTQVTPATYLSLLKGAKELENDSQPGQPGEHVQQATAINERIKYFASQAGMNVTGMQMPADKQRMIGLVYKVQQDIDTLKAQNNGKATAEQVDSAIKNELVQRTIMTERSGMNPRSWLPGGKYSSEQKMQFEMPDGTPSAPTEQWGRDANGNPVRVK
jgi:murein DD-endopeptidase MepM/ murein hydrolase activator NlpD